jgi:mono/diheme cytochrome c family protein
MPTRLLKWSWLGVATAVLLSATSQAQITSYEGKNRLDTDSHIGELTGHAKNAAADYRRYCVGCHGELGDGNGENAPWLDPKPRDFALGIFKCRSTPTGTLPTDQDLYDTIGRGLDGSNMPSWNTFTKQQRADLVAYVKGFSPKFKEEKPGPVVKIPSELPTSVESVRRGSELFLSLNCWLCHGKDGRGHGPSALSLTDSKGYPIQPFDLTSGTRLKCGDSDLGIFRDLTTGLDGTPMPSFADALKPDQIWDLVHFIATLRQASTGFFHRRKGL